MRFMMMYKPDRDAESCGPANPDDGPRMEKYIGDMISSGRLLASEALKPSANGARVRFKAGQHAVTDGPFAEAKELVAGVAIVEAKSKEEAIEMAKSFLEIAGDGETEVRQLSEIADRAF